MNEQILQAGQASVYIGLGSNIEQPYQQIKNALKALAELPDTSVVLDSGYFVSKPMGPEDQPDYLNTVVQISTSLDAITLLKHCQQIEKKQGRIKQRHWGERCIDLDILLYDKLQLESENLTIPHPGVCMRDFVYLPLLKLNPEMEIPGTGLLKTMVESKFDANSDYACRFAGNIE